MLETSEKPGAAEAQSSAEETAEKSSKAPEAKKKLPKRYFPTAIHLVQTYETVYKLSFLLNKKRCLMGSSKSGFSLNCAAIRKLRQLANSQKELPFLPVSPYHQEAAELKQKLYAIIGQSILETMADPIRKFSKQLLQAIADLDAEDESQENRVTIVKHFQKPIESGNSEKTPRKITPYLLVQQLQKSVAI